MKQRSWFRIWRSGEVLGGGFLLTRMYGITAAHCLSPAVPRDETLVDTVLEVDLGPAFSGATGRVVDVKRDLALLEIRHPNRTSLSYPTPIRAVYGDPWRTPYRPSDEHPTLNGKIDDTPASYRLTDGELIEAIQLSVEQRIGDHHGYSGGLVTPATENYESEQVLGIILEQFPDLSGSGSSSNVIFAAAMSVVFDSFEAFDYILDPRDVDEPRVSVGAQVEQSVALPEMRSPSPAGDGGSEERLRDLDRFVRTVHAWKEDGVIDDTDHGVFKMLIRTAAASVLGR